MPTKKQTQPATKQDLLDLEKRLAKKLKTEWRDDMRFVIQAALEDEREFQKEEHKKTRDYMYSLVDKFAGEIKQTGQVIARSEVIRTTWQSI